MIIEKGNNHLRIPTEIAKGINTPRRTVAKTIKRYEEAGSTSCKQLGGNLRSIIQAHHQKPIVDTIDKNNTIILWELKIKIVDEFADIQDISITMLCKHLKHVERITIKRFTSIKEKINDPEMSQKRKELFMSLQPEGILYNKNYIFIDEIGFNINMVRGRARAKAKEQAVIETKTKRTKNVVILFPTRLHCLKNENGQKLPFFPPSRSSFYDWYWITES